MRDRNLAVDPDFNELLGRRGGAQKIATQGTSVSSGAGLITNVKNLVHDFGAIGDSVFNNSTALQNALNAKGFIYIPPGTYAFSTTLTLPTMDENSSLILFGQGTTSSILRYTGTGNAIANNNNRTDQMVFRDFKLESNNASNTGDGFNFIGALGVQTHITIDNVAIFGFGGWGFFSINVQSSVIRNCHMRDNTKGHIAFQDDDLGETSRIPNTNRILDCLLDNSAANAANVAVIRLFNSNETLISGCTLQGHWLGGGGNDPAIEIEQCRAVKVQNCHIEAGSTVTAPGIEISNSRVIEINSMGGSGGHTADVQIIGCRDVKLINCAYANAGASNLIVDSNCRKISVIGGTWSNAPNLTRNDSSPDGIEIIGVSYHDQVNSFHMEIVDAMKDGRVSDTNVVVNGNFTTDTAGWSGSQTGISRVGSGTPPFNTPYILCNTQGIADGTSLGLQFFQAYSVPDIVPASTPYTLSFKFFIEHLGNNLNAVRFVDFEFTGSGFSGVGAFRVSGQDPRFVISRWYTAKVTDILGSGTGRNMTFGITPTTGGDTPRIRFAEVMLTQGRTSLREQAVVGGGDGTSPVVGLDVITTVTGNVGTGETDLHSYSIPAGTLANVGDTIRAIFAGSVAANANGKNIIIKLDGTQLAATGSQTSYNDLDWRFTFYITRLSATSVRRVLDFGFSSNTFGFPMHLLASVADFTIGSLDSGARILKITGTGGASDDILAELTTIEKIPNP